MLFNFRVRQNCQITHQLLTQYGTHRPTVVAIVVAPAHVARFEVQDVSVARVARVKRTTPTVAVRTRIVQLRTAAVARSRQENTITICFTCYLITIYTILSCPSPSTVFT